MAKKQSHSESTLPVLERNVEALAALCERLIEANRLLIENCEQLQEQQRRLRLKNERAQNTIERVLSQLRPHCPTS